MMSRHSTEQTFHSRRSGQRSPQIGAEHAATPGMDWTHWLPWEMRSNQQELLVKVWHSHQLRAPMGTETDAVRVV